LVTPSAADAKLAVWTDPELPAGGGGGGETDALGSPPEHPSTEDTAIASATGPSRTTELAKGGIVKAVLRVFERRIGGPVAQDSGKRVSNGLLTAALPSGRINAQFQPFSEVA